VYLKVKGVKKTRKKVNLLENLVIPTIVFLYSLFFSYKARNLIKSFVV